MAKRKIVPPLYPNPAPIELPPRKLVAFDPETRLVTLEGAPPPELLAWTEWHRRRFDVNRRLAGYLTTCLQRIWPYLSAAEREDLPKQTLPDTLPESAPAEAHDSLLTIQTLNQITAELVKADNWPDEIDRALCLAIELGQLLQRAQVQIDFGEKAALGARVKNTSSIANTQKTQRAGVNREAARQEFMRRLNVKNPPTKSSILTSMSQVLDDEKKPKYGSLRTLKRYSKEW